MVWIALCHSKTLLMVFKCNTEQIKSLSLTPGGYKSSNTHKILDSRYHHKKNAEIV